LQTFAIEQQTIQKNTKSRRPAQSAALVLASLKLLGHGDSPAKLGAQCGATRNPTAALLLGALDLASA
jgi:hypothetical protein